MVKYCIKNTLNNNNFLKGIKREKLTWNTKKSAKRYIRNQTTKDKESKFKIIKCQNG